MYNRILVPVDGSAASNLALLQAIEIAKGMSGELRLLHVVDEFVMDGGFTTGMYYQSLVEALREVGRKTLEEAEATVRSHALEPTSILIETLGHRVAGHVVAQAKEWRADLIVMGTHGRRRLARLLMGSDAEMILRTSPVPVMLVRKAAESA